MEILLKGGHVIDPGHLDGRMDVLLKDGKIFKIVSAARNRSADTEPIDFRHVERVLDVSGKIVTPGLVDMHVHFREPGHEHKETIKTGGMAAICGGFTAVCTMPNTDPVNDTKAVTEYILAKAEEAGLVKIHPCAAISLFLKGRRLSDFDELKKAGSVALSDDGMPVSSSRLMRNALENAKIHDMPIISHAEVLDLSKGGVINEGRVANELNLKGIPNAAESIMVMRDIALCELTGAALHIAHVSTEESVRAIREAKKRGVPVTAETAPHYFILTHDAVKHYGSNAKMNPPLRSGRDREAIIDGLVDGTIDVIATDHAPHHPEEKRAAFEKAPNGIIGLETAVSLGLQLVESDKLSISELIQKMSTNPARILGIPSGLNVGKPADVTVIDMEASYTVDVGKFRSISRNSPFDGWRLKGKPVITIVDGKVVFEDGAYS